MSFIRHEKDSKNQEDSKHHEDSKQAPIKRSSLKLFDKTHVTIEDQAIKADLLRYAVYKNDIDFIKEILDSTGDKSFINFIINQSKIVVPGLNRRYFTSTQEIPRNWGGDERLSKLPRTALTLAVYLNLPKVVETLIEYGADVSLTDGINPLQGSPLKYAVLKEPTTEEELANNHAIISTLLVHNADTKRVDSSEHDIFHFDKNNKINSILKTEQGFNHYLLKLDETINQIRLNK